MSQILDPSGAPVSSASFRQQAIAGENYFDALKRQGFNGYLYFPTLEPNEQMPVSTRAEINKKADWLYKNIPEVRAVIDGLSLDEVDGGIWPKATTENPVFNKIVTNDFHDQNDEPRVFHSGAVQNFYTAQLLIRRSIRQFGELFGQLLRPCMMHFVNAWRCTNARVSKLNQDLWDDGVMYAPVLGRPVKYRFVTGSDGAGYQDFEADDVLHFHDDFFEGQRRGMSCLTPIVDRLFSFKELGDSETLGEMARNRIAYAITRKDDDVGPLLVPGASAQEEIDTGDGGKLIIQKIVPMGGKNIQVAEMPPNMDIKVIESNRGAQTVEFLRWILTSFAHSTLYPPEYVFNLSGLSQGTLVRLVIDRVQRIKNYVRQNQLIPQFVKRWYVFWLWQRIKSGAYDNIEGGIPADWWRAKYLCPGDDTVDVGREGRLYDDRVDSGKMSVEAYHAMSGEDASDVEDENLAAFIRRLEKVEAAKAKYPHLADKISYEAIWTKSKTPVLVPAQPEETPAKL